MDPFGRMRRVLRQVHLWIGLSLCIPMVVLGLTGSILVFHDELAGLLHPQPHLTCAIGKAHTVAETIAAVQARIGNKFKPFLYEPPSAPERPATIRLIALE
ncbi:MAG TPA: PepSY domain-containing protein, partial [Acetobacteraceae bacterium]|nr:PepSY domain-containing protein [Acetobacteraceae bacterium]